MKCAAVVALALLAGSSARSAAQSVRLTGVTTVRYIELRPLVRDSIAFDDVAGAGLLRQLPDGRVVRCVTGEAFCRDTRAGERVATVPLTHDLDVNAWGLGRGVRLFAHVRARTAWGGARELWPRGDDGLELVGAFVEVERARYRGRAGRQWKVSGLGFYNFDGLALTVRPAPAATLELYGGRSLIRGLNEPRTGGALTAADPLAPAAPGALLGVQARYRPNPRTALGATYQTDIRTDGGGTYSELLAFDGSLRIGGGSLESAVELDVATRTLNEARIRARTAPIGRVAAHAEVRRYRPYFELWTIWGAFSPAGFSELQAGATWADARGSLIVRGDAMYRLYDDVGANAPDALRSSGFSVGGSASWSPHADWRADAAYRAETGVGAARRDGQVGVWHRLTEHSTLAAQALAFQRLYEFRLTEGTVVGLGAEASLSLSRRLDLHAAATAYRHLGAAVASGIDWNQRRASVRLQWTVGAEPMLPGAAP